LLNRAINEKQDSSSTAVFRIIESKGKATPGEESKPPAAPDMLFDEAEVNSPTKKARVKKNDTVLTAAVFIGIGNKPYIRGGGAGLSWDSGVAMEFQEIGKWCWVAPADLDGPVEVQLFCNDEEPDKSGKYTVTPGEKLEVSPVF
jgi:hypothetical protein